MKLKRILAGVLTAAMAVTNIPAFGLGGISALADETKAVAGPVRYRPIPAENMTVSADWKCREDAPLENIKSDASNFALSRYNTGGTPRSSMLESNNNIYIKLKEAKDLSKLVWWTNEDKVSGGYGWNVHNGTITRLQISLTTEAAADAQALGSLAEDKWKVQTKGEGKGESKDVRFDSNTNSNADGEYDESIACVAHDIDLSDYFNEVPANITGVRIKVLNTAGAYTLKTETTEAADERDTYINGREIQAYAGEEALTELGAYVDFATETDCGADKLVDGAITSQSRMNSKANETNSPQKHDYGKYFANNNIYFDIGDVKTLGRLTYVPGIQNGSIRRCNIYTSNATLAADGKVADISDDNWDLVYTNVPAEPEEGEEEDTSKDWSAYDSTLSAIGNSKVANFTSFSEARYVRIEVINTQTPGRSTENKWINAGHVYIYEAEPVYTGVEENVALGTSAGGSTTIQCYTGTGRQSGGTGPELIIDGNAGNNNYWGGKMEICNRTDHANYVVLDLKGNIVNLSSIKLTWQKNALATHMRIETADTCTEEGNVAADKDITPNDVPTEGWRLVKAIERSDFNNPQQEYIDEWNADDLEVDKLGRYVRIVMTRTNSHGTGIPTGGLREIEIMGIKETGTLDTIALDVEEPVYKGTLRRPATPASGRYHIDGNIDNMEGFEWYKGAEKLDKATATFEAGTYTLKVKVATALIVDEDSLVATIGGQTANVEVEADKNADGETVLTVSRDYTIESPEAAKTALEALVNDKDIKAVFDTGNRKDGVLIYRISTWEAFESAYRKAQGMFELVPGIPNPDDPDSEVPGTEVWYLKSEYEAAAEELDRTYKGLRTRGTGTAIDTEKDTPDVTVTAPEIGAAPANASLTTPGEIENENLALVKERDHSKNYFRVDSDGYIHGRVTAPNTDPKNEVFNISGNTKFLIKFTAKPKNIGNEREALIGKFNKGYGMQILPAGSANNNNADHDQLIIYGYHNAADWPQTGYLIPDDNWYDKDHEIVAIFNGGYFHLFVDGEAGTEVRKVTGTGDIMSRTLTLDNTAVFTVGYNPEPGDHKNPNNVDEDFQGGLKDVAMYIGENCPQDFSTLTNASKDGFDAALETLLAGKTADMTLTGDPSKYEVTSTKWSLVDGETVTPMKEGDTFEAYRDYKVEVTVTANNLYYFTGQKGILRIGAGEDDVLTNAVTASESEENIVFAYTFPAEEEHPKDALEKYLDGLAEELGVKTENGAPANKEKDTDNKKYTNAAWETFEEVYTAAVSAAAEDKKWGAENNAQTFKAALEDLQEAVGTLKNNVAANTCECTIGTITFAGKAISLEAASATEQMSASAAINHTNCMKHSESSLPVLNAVYTIAEGSTDGIASISGNTLTIEGEGTIKVTVELTLKDGDRTVDTKASTEPAVYTVTSPKADDVSDLQAAIDSVTEGSYNEDDYTPESWAELDKALKAAEALIEKAKAGEEISVAEMSQAIQAITDAIEGLRKKGSETGDSVSDLRNLVLSIQENKKQEDYTADSWNNLVPIFNQAVEELNKTNPDPDVCAALLEQLKDADSKLVTHAQDMANAKSEMSSAIAAADAFYKAGQKDYTSTSWKAFTDAYTAAKNAPADADAATLRKLAAALKAAQAGLKADGLKAGYTETVGTIQYKVLDAGKKTVMAAKGMNNKAANVTIPATVTIKGVSCTVVEIGESAFTGYKKLKKVTIGANVTKIGKKAFFKCKKLNKVILKGKGLTNKSIGKQAFKKTASKAAVKWGKVKGKQRTQLKKALKKAGLKVK